MEWLDGREPTEENASEFANYEDERMEYLESIDKGGW